MALQTGIFSELLRETEKQRRSSLENPETPLSFPAEWLLDIFDGGRTDAGVRVSEITALGVTTFLSCVDLISSAVAALPCHIYERSFLGSGRAVHRIAYQHDLYNLVHYQPNDEMSRFTLMKAFMTHALAWGNAYLEIQRDGANNVVALWPRDPQRTRPYRISKSITLDPVPWRPFPVSLPAGSLMVGTTDHLDNQMTSENDWEGHQRLIPSDDIIHITGLSLDGRLGQSIVQLSRNTLGLALAASKYGSKYFANYAKPGGILELPVGMPNEQRQKTKESWMEAQGGENAHRVAVLPAGTKWTQISNNPEEAQVVQTQSFIRTQICALTHVPPHMVGDVDKTRANTEQLAQEFVSYCLGPWLQAIKQETKRKLFADRGVGRTPVNKFTVDFDLHDMLRPDAASREKFYGTGKQWGYLCSNDCREYEKLNPIDDPSAEEFWIPVNMTLISTPIDPTRQDGAGHGDPAPTGGGGGGGSKKQEGKSILSGLSVVFRDSFARVLDHQKPDLADYTRCLWPVLQAIARVCGDEINAVPGLETEKFLAEYVEALMIRAKSMVFENDTVVSEMRRAVKAIRVAVYNDIARQRAGAKELGR